MDDDEDHRYVARHFWTLDVLARAVGASREHTSRLLAAGCGPGPIYVHGRDGWWSALDRHVRPMPVGPGWYSPGAAWWLRRALLAERNGSTPGQAAALLEGAFVDAFVIELGRLANAACGFPECFAEGMIDAAAARQSGKREWAGWIGGGYGVCLRIFTGETCVAKETLAATMKAALAAETYDASQLLVAAERLAGLILPFAPWQRRNGTPGMTIDRLLAEQQLGTDQSYS